MKNKRSKSKIFHYNFFPKSRKAAIKNLAEKLLWLALFVILAVGVYFSLKFLTST